MIGEQTSPVRMWRLGPWSVNRLMRGSDRLESSVLLLVVALLLLLVPVAAAFGTATNTRLNDQARTDLQTRHQTPATLLADPPAQLADTAQAPGSKGRAPAQWTANGTTHTGQVQTEPEAESGQTISVWIDQAGNLVDPPKTGTENAVAAVGAALTVWTTTASFFLLMLFGIHWAGTRYRMTQWGREWRNLGKAPGWPVS
ncbi:hypothetical protein EEB14_17260 [Rhodococcus sp. WS4]|nr:hypothetical protein EEB14_17260 [Rhodococcus sp. WS4]